MEMMQNGEQFLYFQQGNVDSKGFALSFAERPFRPFALRITGGCGEMTAADAIGMRNVTDALCGYTNRKTARRRFAGFGIFGGTRMISVHDPSTIVPGITEILPNVAKHCPDMEMLGIVAGFKHMVRDTKTPGLADKLILKRDRGFLTIIHPDPRCVLLLQPDPRNEEVWDDEWKETARCFAGLHDKGWGTLDLVYNGGSVTEREIKKWAQLFEEEGDHWNMLLVKDSGRKCSEYAANVEYLEEHPNVHVADNDVDAINDRLWDLGALVECAEEASPGKDKVVPMRRVA